jgi:uncharacterized protein YqjF (DUF2071 family)
MAEQGRPFLTAQWRNLVMLSFQVDPAVVIDRVPTGTVLDSWHGKTFVSLVGFQFLGTKVLGAPVPFHQDFEEVNLRFYVRRVTEEGVRSAVVFICEIVPRPVVGSMARLLYREPYVVVPMRSKVASDTAPDAEYQWHMQDRWHALAARGVGSGAPAAPGSLEEYLTVRHWGYNGEPGKDTLEYRVDHPRWTLWHAQDVRFDVNAEGLCGAELARSLKTPASALVADGSPVTIHWRRRIAD